MKKIILVLIAVLLSVNVYAGAVEDTNNMEAFDHAVEGYQYLVEQNKMMSTIPQHTRDAHLKRVAGTLMDIYKSGSGSNKIIMVEKLNKEDIHINGINEG